MRVQQRMKKGRRRDAEGRRGERRRLSSYQLVDWAYLVIPAFNRIHHVF
jgi:hypothetical protein